MWRTYSLQLSHFQKLSSLISNSGLVLKVNNRLIFFRIIKICLGCSCLTLYNWSVLSALVLPHWSNQSIGHMDQYRDERFNAKQLRYPFKNILVDIFLIVGDFCFLLSFLCRYGKSTTVDRQTDYDCWLIYFNTNSLYDTLEVCT